MRLCHEQKYILVAVDAQCIHGRKIVYTAKKEVEQCFKILVAACFCGFEGFNEVA
jgi:hypothetical protein